MVQPKPSHSVASEEGASEPRVTLSNLDAALARSNYFGFLAAAVAILGVAVATGAGRTISMNWITGVAVPCLIGAAFPVLYIRSALTSGLNTDSRGQLKGIFVILAIAVVIGFCVRDLERTLGLALGGPTKAIDATFQRARFYSRARCHESDSFELSDARVVKVCVRHWLWPKLITTELGEEEHVTLLVQSNFVGDTVVGIRRSGVTRSPED
jgi:hypothetical protein